MRIIVGLGNPGSKYEKNRHNAGFMAVDHIHRLNSGFNPWRNQFHSQTSDGNLAGVKTLLVKPMTFMNESGRAVGEILRYFKLSAEDALIIYDDIDLQPGKFKFKTSGGHGGHNGLRSITAHIGENYHRLRIGVGHPGQKNLVIHHVLNDFAKSDHEWLDPFLLEIGQGADLLVKGNYSLFSNKVHSRISSSSDAGQIASTQDKSEKTDSETPKESSKPGSFLKRLERLF